MAATSCGWLNTASASSTTRHEASLLRKLPIFISSSSEIGCLFFSFYATRALSHCTGGGLAPNLSFPSEFRVLDILVDPE